MWAPGTNLLGVDVTALDVPAFLAAARHAFPFLALLWLAASLRVRRASWLLLGVVLANAYLWVETNWPLQRLYALGPSADRINNLALCQVVAAGHSPLEGPQVGKAHFEPFWAVLTALLSGWDTDRLARLYGFLPLFTSAGLAVSLYFALRPIPADAAAASTPTPPADEPWSPWERATIAAFATLLSSDPLDYTSPYRVPWAMTFLLKPNHAAGLILVPWVLRSFAQIKGGRGRLGTGLLLQLLGWVFVIHMGAVCVGLVVFALFSTLRRRSGARRDWLDVGVVIAVNLVVVTPYLVLLSAGYGVFDSGPRLEIPPGSPHLLEGSTRIAWMALLAAHGAAVALGRDRLGRVWAGQLAGAIVLWLAYYPLSMLQQAKERDDVYYWLRLLIAVFAALGAWDLLGRALAQLRRTAPPAWRAALLGVLVLPLCAPYWWNPARMDLYFAGSLDPLAPEVSETAAFLRGRLRRGDVLAGDATAARWMSALTGARVVLARDFAAPRDWHDRIDLNTRLVRGRLDPVAFSTRWGVTHFLATPALLANYGVPLDQVLGHPYLELLHFAGRREGDYIALFALRRPPA